jgi:hypothetical protein
MLKSMIKWFGIVLSTLFSVCRTLRELALENLALRLSLEKDAPETRASQTPERGRVIKFQRAGGLHHEYSRMAA